MAVQAWFSSDDVDIDPGDSITLTLSLQNLGDSTETYTIIPAGLTADWVSVGQGNLTLFGGATDVVEVTVSPPRLPTTTAGPTGVGVRVIAGDSPDDTVVAETILDVAAFDDRRISALQPVIRARHRANYEFMVENHGNGLASCRVRLIDPTDRIDGDFDPPAVGVAPGGASLVRLKAKAKRGGFRRVARHLDFEVEAEQQGHEPSAAPLSLVQPKTIPADTISKVLAVAATLGLVALGWFHVVKPEIHDAARNQVDNRLGEINTRFDDLAASNTGDPTASTVPDAQRPATDDGEPLDIRLETAPAQLDTGDEAYTVPNGQLFDVTDVRVENSNGDGGRATLSINGEVAYRWTLASIRPSLFEPSISPTRLEPGDIVTLSTQCDTVGAPDLGTCLIAVNLGGRVIQIDEL